MRLFALLLTAALATACRKPTSSSPEYEEARAGWTALLRDKGFEGAFQDPRSEEVARILGRVDPKSADALYAAQLRAEIEAGRRQAQERAAALQRQEQEMSEAASRAASAMSARAAETPATFGAATPDAGPEPASAADAGAADDQPRVGMESERFKRDFARCFEYKNSSVVQGRTGGEVWGLKDLMICRDLHKPFVSNSILLMDGKLLAVRPSAELAPKLFQVIDGKLVEMDAGVSKP